MKNTFQHVTRKDVLVVLVLIGLMLLSSQLLAHGISEAEIKRMTIGGFWNYIVSGATHMLTGYDHLLFVFGVVFLLSRFMDIIKYVTGFTVGHTITLISATYFELRINTALIDALIALSVCYIAFVNLGGFKKYFNMQAPNLLATVVVIGLVHGLGLSTVLQELFDQLPVVEDKLVKIISFNVGIEFGQIGALVVMLLLINVSRTVFVEKSFLLVSQMFLIFAGSLLFLMQMHNYLHSVTPEPGWFDKDSHEHMHVKPAKKPINLNKATHHGSL